MKKAYLVIIGMLGITACGERPDKGNDLNAWYGAKVTTTEESKSQTILACRTKSSDKATHHYYYVTVEEDSKEQVSESSWNYTKATFTLSEAQVAEKSSNIKTLEVKKGILRVEKTALADEENKNLKYPATLYRIIENEEEIFSVGEILTIKTNLTERELPGVTKGQALDCQ